MSPVVDRPEVTFDAIAHAYQVEGVDVLGVSTIAKIGGAESAFNIASAWGFRIGYEGAFQLLGPLLDADAVEACHGPTSADELRAELNAAGLTPWATRDRAAERGSWVHDALEELGQEGEVPDMGAFAEKHGAEAAGHFRSVLRWYLHFRPSFVGMEVQVASVTHGFAGRYDVRAKISARRLIDSGCVDPLRRDAAAERLRELAQAREPALCLIDLKTSKRVYPETHFPQLAGYELAGVEMGFPATDAQLVLNTWPDGSFDAARDFQVSWSTGEDFLAYLAALRAIRRIAANDPEHIRERAREDAILAHLPATSRELVDLKLPELAGLDARAIGRIAGALRRRGKVVQDPRSKAWRLAQG